MNKNLVKGWICREFWWPPWTRVKIVVAVAMFSVVVGGVATVSCGDGICRRCDDGI